MAVRRNYRINLRNYGNPPAIMVSQYDENYDLVFEVYDGVVPATGLNAYTVKLVGRQPGDDPALKYEFTGTVSGIANNILSFTIDTTMTGRAGKGTAEIVILDTTNDVKFASFNLPVYVEKAAVPDDAIDADVERAQEIADEVQDIVDTAAAEVKGEAEAWAVGQRDGEDVPSTDPTYHNNAKYYAEQAQDIADSIGIDATLSISGKAADAKKTGDEISSLKEDLNDNISDLKSAFGQNLDSIRKAFPASSNMFNADDPGILVGKYITNTGASASYEYINTSYFIPVEASTAYFIGSDQNNFPRYISEYDSTKTLIPNSGASEANITTTANTAYIRFSYRNDSTNWRMTKGSTKQPYEPYYYDYIKTDNTLTNEYLPANAKAVGEKIERLGFTEVEYVADDALNLTWAEGYVDKGGHSHGGASYHYSNHITVSEGDEIYTNGTYTLRFVCAYNSIGQAVSASGAESVLRYTVPSGITEVVVSLLTAYTGEIRHAYTENELVASSGSYGYFRAEGNLSDGDALTLPVTNIDKNIRQTFTADISSFSSVLIGRKNGNKGYWVVIDATNITVYHDNVASTPIPHGLTIRNNLQIRIITKHNVSIPNELYNADITVTSNGIDFTAQDIEWRGTYNPPVVQSVGSVLTDCVMSWESGDVGKAIYMFGDSYFSWGVDRWTYYCAKDGFDENGLFNAYPGENSANAIIALRNVVPLGKPKYLVWCLGMNDGSDSESAPSSAWVTGRDTVINLCKRYGITPVFATIPTVPTINHEQKNAWVRSSGYRYIDFAKAVGAQSDGTWFSGMLYTDEVHPTVQGAKALYGRVLTDFPEIMVSN